MVGLIPDWHRGHALAYNPSLATSCPLQSLSTSQSKRMTYQPWTDQQSASCGLDEGRLLSTQELTLASYPNCRPILQDQADHRSSLRCTDTIRPNRPYQCWYLLRIASGRFGWPLAYVIVYLDFYFEYQLWFHSSDKFYKDNQHDYDTLRNSWHLLWR